MLYCNCTNLYVLDEIDILKVISPAVVNSACQNSELSVQNCANIEKILDPRLPVEFLLLRMTGVDSG